MISKKPWTFETDGEVSYIFDADNEPVELDEDLKHIVNAVNMHDKLVEAVEDLLKSYKYAYKNILNLETHKTVIKQVEQLLQQVKE